MPGGLMSETYAEDGGVLRGDSRDGEVRSAHEVGEAFGVAAPGPRLEEQHGSRPRD